MLEQTVVKPAPGLAQPVSRPASARSQRATWLFVALCCLLSIYAAYPGHMSFDSAYQWWQIRTGFYSNVSPVVMTLFWRGIQSVMPGPGGMLILNQFAYWTALGLIASLLFDRTRSRWWSVAVLGFGTPAVLVSHHIWTDAAVVSSLVLALALTYLGYVRGRRTPLLLALPLLAYGSLVRHNALLAGLPLYVLWSVALTHVQGMTARRARIFIVIFPVIFLATTFLAGIVIDRAFVKERLTTSTIIVLWDLAAISLQANEMLIPYLARERGTTLADLSRDYSSETSVPLFGGAKALRDGFGFPYSDEQLWELRYAWLRAVAKYPLFYLHHRWDVTRALFSRRYSRTPTGLIYSFGITSYRDNPSVEENATLAGRWFQLGFKRLSHWWIWAPVVFIFMAFAILVRSWQRRTTPRGALQVTAASSALLYALPLSVIAPSAELRYTAWSCLAAVIGLMAGFARDPVDVGFDPIVRDS